VAGGGNEKEGKGGTTGSKKIKGKGGELGKELKWDVSRIVKAH